MKVTDIFQKPLIIGLIGDVNTGKSNLLYHIVESLREEGKFNLYTYGLRNNIKNSVQIFSVNELEQIKNAVIVLDELYSLFDLENRKIKKQIENTLRLINHNNNILVLCMLPENVKKFISGKLNIRIFTKCTFEDFINGSSVKRAILEYKGPEKGTTILNLDNNEALIHNREHYYKIDVPYYEGYDSKKDNEPIVQRGKKK